VIPKSLSKAIIALLSDRNKAEKMGCEGRKFVETHYSMDSMVKKMHNLYTSLLSENKKQM